MFLEYLYLMIERHTQNINQTDAYRAKPSTLIARCSHRPQIKILKFNASDPGQKRTNVHQVFTLPTAQNIDAIQ